MEISALKATSDALEAGEWVDNLPHLGDVALCIRPVQSHTVKRALGRAMRAVGPEGRSAGGDILPDVQDEIDHQVTLDVILVDWKNLTQDGEPLPYDRELAAEWLRLPLFAGAVRLAAQRAAAKADKRLEDLKGNS